VNVVMNLPVLAPGSELVSQSISYLVNMNYLVICAHSNNI
jgi:hypothetical protein